MFNVLILLLLLSGAVISALSILAFHRGASTLVRLFGLSMVCAAIWNFAFAAEILSPSLDGKVFWSNIQFLGIAFLPLAWLGMSLSTAGMLRRSTGLILGAGVLPLLTNVVIWTNPFHKLFRGEPALITEGVPFPVLYNDYGIYFYAVHAVSGYIFLAVSLLILVRALRKAKGIYRRQILILVVSVVLPFLVDLLYVVGVAPISGFNFTSVTFTLSGLLLGFNILQNQFLDILPLAYDAAVNEMHVGVIVLDSKNRVSHLNPAAERITGISGSAPVGMIASEVFPALIDALEDSSQISEVAFMNDGRVQTFELQGSNIVSTRGKKIGQVLTLHDVTDRVELHEEVKRLSITDPLTDAYNRRALTVYGEEEIQRAYRYHRSLSLILIDVDNFKEINDHHGHQCGDNVLKAIVGSIRRSVRTTDRIFRYGGDEFVVLLVETDPAAALSTAERIRSDLLTISVCEENQGPQEVKISLGVTGLTSNDTPEKMLQRADRALYEAKAAGKDRVVLA